MNLFVPKTGSEAEWNAAYDRLEEYLRALRISSRAQQGQIILRWLRFAAAQHAEHPEQSPVAVAMEAARADLERWLIRILPQGRLTATAGLVSLLAADAPSKWPAAFLADEIPPELREALQNHRVPGNPPLQVSNMLPQPFETATLFEILKQPIQWARLGWMSPPRQRE